MKALIYNLRPAFLPKARRICLLGMLLLIALVFTGCRGEQILGENSLAGLQSQFSGYQKNQSKTWGNTERSVNAYIADEKKHFNDVSLQYDDYKQGQGDDISQLKISLKRWIDAR